MSVDLPIFHIGEEVINLDLTDPEDGSFVVGTIIEKDQGQPRLAIGDLNGQGVKDEWNRSKIRPLSDINLD